jgi:hypothetical protein
VRVRAAFGDGYYIFACVGGLSVLVCVNCDCERLLCVCALACGFITQRLYLQFGFKYIVKEREGNLLLHV